MAAITLLRKRRSGFQLRMRPSPARTPLLGVGVELVLFASEEGGKGPKKTFAPPAQKLHSLMPCSLNSSKEEILGISSPEAEARPSLLQARLEKKEEKATTENGPGGGQKIKRKAQNEKKAEKKEKEKSSLTDAEFEEIVQIVLRKSLQECLDLEYNRCDIPEETWIGRESDVAYASYIPGSIIWAKQYGYPWWPGMVESDPDLGEYFLFASHLDSLPSKYHVTFFGETVSRAWIPVNMLKNFQELSLELAGLGKLCREKVPCLTTCTKERVNLFGFWSRYSGSDDSGGGKGKKGPGSQEPQPQEARSIPSDDEASSDLDLDQLMEDVGKELEQGEELQHRDDTGESARAFFEE
ncbi:hypothetical protein CB1_046108002 [Camelus ferus]|nr:hypothetical protein CB1_046108002 [Camelus ferus]